MPNQETIKKDPFFETKRIPGLLIYPQKVKSLSTFW